jgi:hypothetical protein
VPEINGYCELTVRLPAPIKRKEHAVMQNKIIMMVGQMTETWSGQGVELFQRFREAAGFFSRTRDANFDMLVQFADLATVVSVRAGQVRLIEQTQAPLLAFDFAVKGSAQAWQAFWLYMPAAGWHDIFALHKRKAFSIEGNLQPFMAHLQFIKDLLASPRERQA